MAGPVLSNNSASITVALNRVAAIIPGPTAINITTVTWSVRPRTLFRNSAQLSRCRMFRLIGEINHRNEIFTTNGFNWRCQSAPRRRPDVRLRLQTWREAQFIHNQARTHSVFARSSAASPKNVHCARPQHGAVERGIAHEATVEYRALWRSPECLPEVRPGRRFMRMGNEPHLSSC
jgi:hypothetical protein